MGLYFCTITMDKVRTLRMFDTTNDCNLFAILLGKVISFKHVKIPALKVLPVKGINNMCFFATLILESVSSRGNVSL